MNNQKPTENRSIKNRLYQTLVNKSPKHPFLLEEDKDTLAPVLKPKKMQEGSSPTNAKLSPVYNHGKMLLHSFSSPDIIKKKPKEVVQEKLSKEAKSIIEEGKNRLRTNLKPHDIFQLYDNFPEMMQDFFYLNRASHPYDYQIVTYAQRNPAQYMTISSQGVTLYHDKEAQFLTKQEWMIDEKRYYALQKIYFFKQYKLCKNFRIWKNKMKRHYMREMSGILNEHLFLTFKFPRRCLLEVRYFTNSLKDSLNFFPYDNLEKLSPHQFLTIMQEYRNNTLLKGIRQVTHAITQSLQIAVTEQINKFKNQNNIKIDGVNDKQTTNKQGYIYSQQAILRKQYKRVYKLIKLADSMLQQSKVQMVIRCLQQLIDRIRQLYVEDKEPWITCTASIQQNGAIHWQPDCTSLSELFLKSIRKNIESLNQQNQKIINNPLFTKYRLADSGEIKTEEGRNSFKVMIEESPNFYALLSGIQQNLVKQFQTTENQETALQKFISIYIRHKNLASMSVIFQQNNGVDLCGLVDQWKKDQHQMHELSEDKKGKLILYNYSDLRKKIIHEPKKTLTYFFQLLPEETATRCKQLIYQSKSLLDGISVYPTQIVGFAKFNKAVKQAAQRLQDIKSAGSQICLLIDLMSKNKLSNVELYNTKKIQALNSINALKSKVDQSQAKQNQSLSKFKKDNEGEVIKIKALVKDLNVRFNTIEFNQTKATARQMKQILTKIRQILPPINSLQNQSRKIQQIQIDLNLTQTDFSEVHQLYDSAKIVNDIWTCRDEWKTMLVNLYHKHYCEVDCLQLKQKWQQFSNQINGLTKVLPENQILKNLSQQLSEVEVLIDTIVALRSPNLQQKSWKQISQYLAYELGLQNEAQLPFSNIKNPQYTVKWLLEINIPVYKQKIQFIVRKSEKEKELIVHLSEFKNYITNLTFENTPRKREVYTFTENLDVQDKIHQNLSQLYIMLDNQYSQSIKNQAEALIRHYEYAEQIMKAVLQFGMIWNKYQSFFDGNSGSLKLLTKESKQFASWQTQWKKIIKIITTDSLLFYKKICDQTTGVNCSRSTMKQIIKINTTIDQVKKGLQDYLQKKRANFPRYYYLSDQKLLQMLANVDTKEPISASFVPIIYKNIQKIIYKQDTKDTLLGIVSKQGQQFSLKNVSFKLQSQMQDIFKLAEQQIKKRLSSLIKTIFIKYTQQQITRQKIILENNTQVVLAIDLIAWVRLAEETYLCPEPIGDLYDWLEIQQSQIKEIKNLLSNKNQTFVKYRLMQLLSQSLYLKQKTQHLLKLNILTTECYQWERIPKLCMNSSNSDIYLKQLNNKLNYCFQFMGNASVSYILPQTEKIWISVGQAIAAREVVCLQSYISCKLQTIKQLGYLIAQQVEQVQLGQKANFKMVQRYINAGVFTGNWVCFNNPISSQMISFLANQLNHVRKAITDTNLMTNTKSTFFYNSNVSFFLSMSSQLPCNVDNLLNHLPHQNISLAKPNLSVIFGVMSLCWGESSQMGIKTVQVCQIMRECFELSYTQLFTRHFIQQVLENVCSVSNQYQWLKCQKCKQYYEYITCDILDTLLLPLLRKDDSKVYETLKCSIVSDYQKLKIRHSTIIKQQNISYVSMFLQNNKLAFLKKHQFTQQLDQLAKTLQSNSIGVILYGETLSGKTMLIDLAAKMLQQQNSTKIQQHRIYHNAYKKQQIFNTDKNIAIFPQCLNDIDSINWIIFDGQISQDYMQLFGKTADKYVVPHVGTIIPSPQLKFIIETYDITNISPSIIGNHSLYFVTDVVNSEVIVRKLFVKLQEKGLLANLQIQTLEWLISGLVSILSKLESKGTLKSKLINFAYPLNSWEITHRCCRLVEAIFIMNWESLREKQKNMKKLIDKFVSWAAYQSLIGLVLVEDEAKLEKCINQLSKSDATSSQDYANCMIYPGCGLQIQQINGLRTQSSLSIPQKGIITNLLRSDLITEIDPTKGNKFYEQIVISEAQLIRVNYDQSNKFNYLAQLSTFTDTPIMLIGAANTGKKSIIELYAKNMRAKTQFYSIRYHGRQHLANQIQRPFRKIIGLDGIILKSISASKKVLISIQDISMNDENRMTTEMLRMMFSEMGYHNKQAQWIKLSNCSFNLIANKMTVTPDNTRFLPNINLFQTVNNSIQKLHSIFSPYLKNWCAFNGMGGEVQRIFSSQNGDTLLDATLSIFKMCDQLQKNDFQRGTIQSLLIRPRIGDITKAISYICRTPQANHYNLTYYYQLWAHEVVRVFGDRLPTNKQKQLLFKQIKKQALVKFKQNFNINGDNMFTFTSLGIQNQNCYIRIQDASYLHTYISNLLEADQITLPLKYLFAELLEYLLRIYRIIAIEGAHLLLLTANPSAGQYLIQLACQVGQNDSYKLKGEIISVEKHIEPTLYYKDNVCITDRVERLTENSIYQMTCLLNNNVYDFALKGQIRDKIKANLNKKEKQEIQKKQSKVFGKTKNNQVKVEQKEEDIEVIMSEQFMNYAHFILQADPTSPTLKQFLNQNNDIVGKLHFSWIDIPQQSIVKVAKQILNFDQEINDMMSQGHSDDKLIERARLIYSSLPQSPYFNDLLTISQLVKSQSARMGKKFTSKQKELKQGRQFISKVKNVIAQKEQMMRCLQQELEETNNTLEQKCKELEDVNNKIGEWQMNTNGEEISGEGLEDIRVQREEIQIQIKLIKEKKQRLQPEKKKILKNIKIANDYLEIFGNSTQKFDKQIESVSNKITTVQDKLLIAWSAISYLPKVHVSQWVSYINQWFQQINSKVPPFQNINQIYQVMQDVYPPFLARQDLFSDAVRIKVQCLFLTLNNYEETVLYGKIPKVYDPTGIFLNVLQNMSNESNSLFCLLKTFPAYNRQVRGQIESLCKMKNGLIIIESSKDVEQLQNYFQDKKMVGYFNKIIVLSNQSQANFTIECTIDQLKLSIQDLILKQTSPGMYQERITIFQQIIKEKRRHQQNQQLFYHACASINIDTQTYTEEINKYKNILNTIDQTLSTHQQQVRSNKFSQLPQFQMEQAIIRSLGPLWMDNQISFKHMQNVYRQAIYIKNCNQCENMSLQQKGKQLQTTVAVNLGDNRSIDLATHIKYAKKWDNKIKIFIVKPDRCILQQFENNKQFKTINLLSTPGLISHIQQHADTPKVLYNFISELHTVVINQLIEKQFNQIEENKNTVMILMAEECQLQNLDYNRLSLSYIKVSHSDLNEDNNDIEKIGSRLENVKKYLIKTAVNAEHQKSIINCIEKNSDLAKTPQELTKLILDFTHGQNESWIFHLLNYPSCQLQAILSKISKKQDNKQRRTTQLNTKIQLNIIKQQLPFLFNTSQFLPTKDPLAVELISECFQFNKRLKQIKDSLKQAQFDWEEFDRTYIIPTNDQIQFLNAEYSTLKKNLIKLHVVSANNMNNNPKTTSHKTLSATNIAFQNVLRFSYNLITPKILNILKCRAAKKFKTIISNISLVWKLSCTNFNFQQNLTSADLCLVVQGKLHHSVHLLANWTHKQDLDKKIQLIICPIESHDPKTNPQMLYIPIKNGANILGHFQINKGELSPEYILGLEHPYISLQKIDF